MRQRVDRSPVLRRKGGKAEAVERGENLVGRSYPLYQRPWHFATSHRIMKQHVGLRLWRRRGLCFAFRGMVYCVANPFYIALPSPQPLVRRLYPPRDSAPRPRYTRIGIRWLLLTSHVEQRRHV